MNTDPPAGPSSPVLPAPPPTFAATPWSWRLGLAAVVVGLTGLAYALHTLIGPRGQAVCGVFAFFALAAVFSANLRAVNWRTIGAGVALQLLLAVLVLRVEIVGDAFRAAGRVVDQFLSFSSKGAEFVFGNIANPDHMAKVFGSDFLFPFAFVALPPIIFISAFFTVLYYFGILQFVVRLFARVMMFLMGTSGAETLSVAANVFMGQTEAPLIVKPFVPRMTNSELFTLMVSGMAHISGGMLAVYMGYMKSAGHGDSVGDILTTCIMACPCSLYLAKLVLPEMSKPETLGSVRVEVERAHVNAIDAAAAGTADGLRLALNVAAMLISFIAFVALFDALLGVIKPGLIGCGIAPASLVWFPDDLSLQTIFGWLFSPAAILMGVEPGEAQKVGSLLGIKLALNEHVAYLTLAKAPEYKDLSERSVRLAMYALTGFANFASVGIQLGGIGAIAPERRHDLARLGGRALFVGFLATLLNAAIAGILM